MTSLRTLVCLMTFSLVACVHQVEETMPDDALSPDLIHNPATASTQKKDVAPAITFDDPVHDFGTISKGEVVSYSFHFKNTGNADLIIRHAQTTCGCTVPKWPKEPLAPGKEGYISVRFDSNGKSGAITKTVNIISNTVPSTTKLTITAQIQE